MIGVLAGENGEQVRSALGALPTRGADGVGDGARVTALVRPEQIRVLPEGVENWPGTSCPATTSATTLC